MGWTLGAGVGQVAVPITVICPSRGMLLGFPAGRANAKFLEPVAIVQIFPSAPVACGSKFVSWLAGLGYTQYLIRPGTPPTGFSSVSETNVYVVIWVWASVEKNAPTLLAIWKFFSAPVTGQEALAPCADASRAPANSIAIIVARLIASTRIRGKCLKPISTPCASFRKFIVSPSSCL